MPVTLLEALRSIPDHRRAEGKRFDLATVLLYAVLGMVAGANSYRQMHEFIRIPLQRLNEAFGLRLPYSPSRTGLRLIILGVDRQGCSTLSTEGHCEHGFDACDRGGEAVLRDCFGLIAAQDVGGPASHSGEDPRIFSDARGILAERDVARVMGCVVSRPEGFHLRPLAERCGSLSTHTAPIKQTLPRSLAASARTDAAASRLCVREAGWKRRTWTRSRRCRSA